MKVGEPHCMSQYFRTTLPFLSVPCPWVELSPPPPPHAAAIRDRDVRVAASARRRRLVLAMVNSLEGVLGGCSRAAACEGGAEPWEGLGKGAPQSSGKRGGKSSGGKLGARPWCGGGERLSCRLPTGCPVGHRRRRSFPRAYSPHLRNLRRRRPVVQLPDENAASKAAAGGSICVIRRMNARASGAPTDRSMP